jgi:hypothetical protein
MKYRLALILLATTALSACGSSNNPTAPTAPPVVVVPSAQENAFGANFGTAFRASNTAAPTTPVDGDIIPLSLTTNPVNVG